MASRCAVSRAAARARAAAVRASCCFLEGNQGRSAASSSDGRMGGAHDDFKIALILDRYGTRYLEDPLYTQTRR
jgi:hypothetical protein